MKSAKALGALLVAAPFIALIIYLAAKEGGEGVRNGMISFGIALLAFMCIWIGISLINGR